MHGGILLDSLRFFKPLDYDEIHCFQPFLPSYECWQWIFFYVKAGILSHSHNSRN